MKGVQLAGLRQGQAVSGGEDVGAMALKMAEHDSGGPHPAKGAGERDGVGVEQIAWWVTGPLAALVAMASQAHSRFMFEWPLLLLWSAWPVSVAAALTSPPWRAHMGGLGVGARLLAVFGALGIALAPFMDGKTRDLGLYEFALWSWVVMMIGIVTLGFAKGAGRKSIPGWRFAGLALFGPAFFFWGFPEVSSSAGFQFGLLWSAWALVSLIGAFFPRGVGHWGREAFA